MKVREIIKDELSRIGSRNLYIVVLVVIPLFTILFLATIFGKGVIEEVPVGAVDYSCSILSGKILDKADASPTLKVTNVYLNEDEAIRAMQEFKVYGFVVIPPNFDRELYSGHKPEVVCYYHKSALAVGEEVNGAFLKVLADVASSFIEESGAKGGLPKETLKAVAMPVNINGIPEYNSDLNFTSYITYPFILIFLQILLIVLVIYTLGNEDLPRSRPAEIPYRVVPYIAIFGIYTIAATFVCFNILGIPSNGNIIALALSGILLFTATAGVGILIACIIPNLSIAISIGSMYGALGATTCGITFPIEQMDKWVQILAQLFPVRDFTLIYHNITYRGLPATYSIMEIAILVGFSSLIWSVPYIMGLRKKGETKKKVGENEIIYGLALIVLGGTIGYSLLYNIIYMPNKVKEVPVAVCDASSTSLSREFISTLDATSGVEVIHSLPDYPQAQLLMKEHKVRGIIYIPHDFAQRIATSKESIFILEGTTTSFLYYLAMQESCVGAMQKINGEYRDLVLNSIPLEGKLALASAPQMAIASVPLTNEDGGYATFLLPVVLIVALFQTMLMAMGVWRGRSLWNIFGFASIYAVITIFVIGFVPTLFNLPYEGSPLYLIPFIILFLVATACTGYFLSSFFTDSESVNLLVPFFSIGLIFLSGMSYPRECMPWFWQMAYYILPCPPAITGYIKLNSLGAGLEAVTTEMITMAIQAIIYGVGGFLLWKNRERVSLELYKKGRP